MYKKKAETLLGVLMIPMWIIFIACCVLQVLGRYVLNFPMQWTEEIARLALVWLTFFGALLLLLANDHIEIGFVRQLGSRTINVISNVLKYSAVFLTGIYFAVGGMQLTKLTGNSRAPGSGFSLAAWNVPLLVAGVAMMAVVAGGALLIWFRRK